MTATAPLAVTMGEPAGIGGELSLKAWSMRQRGARPFFVLDDAARLAALADRLGLDVPLRQIARPADAAPVFETALPVLPVRLRVPARAGHPDPANAPATLEAIERGVQLALAGEIAGMVTNPIQKKTLQEAGFRHPGHTEYLAELAGGVDVAMMLACPELRVVPVTIHLSLAEAVRTLDSVKIIRAGRLAAAGLKALFGIERPRLAVAGLNPACRRAGLDGRRRGPGDRAGDRSAEARWHRRARSGAGRHAVPRRRPGDLRRGPLHVSRPGPDPDQDRGLRRRGQRDPGLALRADLARPRHGARYRRHRPCRSGEPHRRAAHGGRHGPPAPHLSAKPALDGLARLPPLRETIAAHGLDARKRLGQHFLLDLNLTRRIARAAAPLAEGTVVEVGPGPGGLTRALLLEGATHVVAIEVDSRAVAALQELVEVADGRLQVVQADALQASLADLGPSPRRIVANLPYNVSTALLVRWLHQADDVADMVLMFQKEVADRLVALPRSKDYGRLSVLAQHVCAVQRLFDVAPSAFVPPPKVTSSVVRLTPYPADRRLADLQPLERVTAASFGQRRKMLRGALRGLFADPAAILNGLGLSPTARAEELTVADFVRLAGAVSSMGVDK